MLKQFKVKNCKGFEDEICLDFTSSAEYNFNNHLIKNNLVNKALIYGQNGSGKSNLGYAIFDITNHLTDKDKPKNVIGYTNGNLQSKVAEFSYTFQFDNEDIKYEYGKTSPSNLVYERLYIRNKLSAYYDYRTGESHIENIKGAETLNVEIPSTTMSFIRYIYRNCVIDNKSSFASMMKFVQKMVRFSSSPRQSESSDYGNLLQSFAGIIEQDNALRKFERFLMDNHLNYNLEFKKDLLEDVKVLTAKFKYNEYPFSAVCSSGTGALLLFFCWALQFNKVSFLYMDEFDAFYHFETSEYILKYINSESNIQSIVTTHNTVLMSNKVTRPDCTFIISNGKIHSLPKCTDKEIREAHNLEKMYRGGSFSG